jgi:uncharacterized protein with NAD-binding domain and iron-sulfur cluster
MSDTQTNDRPIKVAILGGGAGGISAAWALTEPERSQKYEVTVYQMGWRLGGKGASGRNAERGQRIEEHGLHMWFGFYENAFRVMRACYEEWKALRPESPIQECIGEAFLPHRNYVLNEALGHESWGKWLLDLPDSPHVPGDDSRVGFRDSMAFHKLTDLVNATRLVERGAERGLESVAPSALPPTPVSPASPGEHELLGNLHRRYGRPNEESVPTRESRSLPGGFAVSTLLQAALDILASGQAAAELVPVQIDEQLEGIGDDFRKGRFRAALAAAAVCLGWARFGLAVARKLRPDDEPLRRLWMSIDFAAALASGLSDDIFGKRQAFKDLDGENLYDWLVRHGADKEMIRVNPIVRFPYSVVFAFVDGDASKPQLAAGAALQGLMRLFLTYKGSLAYRMAAGMGDIVFAPFYEVLEKRGVKFRFFHRVDDITLATRDGQLVVDRIELTEQAQVLHGKYRPLIDVEKFPCWPNQPDWNQLRNGDELCARAKRGEINLEAPGSHAGDGFGKAAPPLVAGVDFDHVVLAIPVGALAGITKSFAQHGAFGKRWQEMLKHGKTIPTQGMQLWLNEDLVTLGGEKKAPVWGTYAEPLDTYADMSHALKLEQGGAGVKQLAYFCGALPFVGDDHGAALAAVRAAGAALLKDHAHGFWPKIGKGPNLCWNRLHVFDDATATRLVAQPEASFEGQYFRANILAGERFSATFPGSTQYRLPPGLPQVGNLFLAGDWTDNHLNVGCVEATVMSGLMAARALSGDAIRVVGDNDDYLWLGADPEDELPAIGAPPAPASAPAAQPIS